MKDVITNTSLTELTLEELLATFGGSDDQTTVLDGLLDPAGGVVVEDYDL